MLLGASCCLCKILKAFRSNCSFLFFIQQWQTQDQPVDVEVSEVALAVVVEAVEEEGEEVVAEVNRMKKR